MIILAKEKMDIIVLIYDFLMILKRGAVALDELFMRFKVKDYYIRNHEKEVTVYEDGHGIISYRSDICIFERHDKIVLHSLFDISDGCINSKIDYNNINDCCGKDRFDKSAFKCTTTVDGVEILKLVKVKEHHNKIYDSRECSFRSVNEHEKGKVLSIEFIIDPQKLNKKTKIVTLEYSFCNPKMFPIESGVLDKANAIDNEHYSVLDDGFNSSLLFERPIRNFRYLISFDKDVKIDRGSIEVKLVKSGTMKKKIKKVRAKRYDGLFYNKYRAYVRKPKFNSHISYRWEIEEA